MIMLSFIGPKSLNLPRENIFSPLCGDKRKSGEVASINDKPKPLVIMLPRLSIGEEKRRTLLLSSTTVDKLFINHDHAFLFTLITLAG